jgi:hypothetical protein
MRESAGSARILADQSGAGSWLLGVIVTSLITTSEDLPDLPAADRRGNCTGWVLMRAHGCANCAVSVGSNKCISYLTIDSVPIPEEIGEG